MKMFIAWIKGLLTTFVLLFAVIGLGSFLEELRRAKQNGVVNAQTDDEPTPSTEE